MRLALALGWPSVEWGLNHMGSQELTEWMAFFELEGFGDDRMDLRLARLMQLFASAHNDEKRNPNGYKVSDFLYPWQVGDEEEIGDNSKAFGVRDEAEDPAQQARVLSKRTMLKAQIG